MGKKAAWNANPTYGNYICSSLDCAGHKHGESWCVYDSPRDNGQDTVGSRDFKEICADGEILQEPCADFRNEICVEGKSGSYNEARCTVNKWQDCLQQLDQEDCTDVNARDCYWMDGYYHDSNTNTIKKSDNITDTTTGEYLTGQGVCLPRHPPGFNFWGSSSSTTNTNGSFSAPTTGSFGTGYVEPKSDVSASDMCSLGNGVLTVTYEKIKRPLDIGIFGDDKDWQCKGVITTYDGNEYITTGPCELMKSKEKMLEWANEMNSICYSLGDCGGYTNWIGEYTEEGFAAYNISTRFAGSGGSKIMGKNTSSSSSSSSFSSSNSNSSSGGTTDSGTGLETVSQVAGAASNIKSVVS
jgi:hypothetical protein